MAADQKKARIFGVLYLITFVTSIPALVLYQPVLDHPAAYIASAGRTTGSSSERCWSCSSSSRTSAPPS